MAVLQAVTIVVGFDEAIVKTEEESRKTSVRRRRLQHEGERGRKWARGVAYGVAALPDGWPW